MEYILVILAVVILSILLLDFIFTFKHKKDKKSEELHIICSKCLYPLSNNFFIWRCKSCRTFFIRTEGKMHEIKTQEHDIFIEQEGEDGGKEVKTLQEIKSGN